MEFINYTSPPALQIISLLKEAKYKIQENTSECSKEPSVFGFMFYNTNRFIICTSNIKRRDFPLRLYVNETIIHEAVHAAQDCKTSGLRRLLGPGTLGIKNVDKNLSKEKLDEAKRSSSLLGASLARELEAYYLESKPKQVIGYLHKYCIKKPIATPSNNPQIFRFDNVR